jgi:predicted O-linked N-acetylglucosamine transferase (SPINDLY family)
VSPQTSSAQAELEAALAHQQAGRLSAAATIYTRLLERDPTLVDALHLLGLVCQRLGRLDEAARLIARAVALKPEIAELHNSLGTVLQSQGKLDEAAAAFEAAVARRSDFFDPHGHLGVIRQAQGRLDETVAHYRRALALRPDTLELMVNLAVALNAMGRLDEAIALFRRAIELRPEVPEIHNNLACALRDQGRLDLALPVYRRALALRPGYQRAHSNLIGAMDWTPGITMADAQAERRRWYLAHRCAETARFRDWPNRPDPERMLRLGYVSADFRRHSAAFAFGPVLWGHDRSRFEVVCYSGVAHEDDFTQRFRAGADLWRPMAQLSDDALAQQIRADTIDVLIDLSGHTVGNRLIVFSAKPAPVQVSAWGAVTGTGIPEIDALLADPIMIPAEERGLFAETIVDLPCMLTYGAPDDAPAVAPLPASAQGHVTFGCLNRLAKVSDAALALWARVLAAVPDSRLLLKDKALSDDGERARTIERLTQLGIAPARVVLQGGTDHRSHLAACGAVDVALDPFPQNGGVSTLEALWMGAPVVTLLGAALPGRAGAALLTPLGLGDLIARSADDYVAIACRLAADLPALAALRAGLRARILASPIGDRPRYVAAVEAAYRGLWRRWCASR